MAGLDPLGYEAVAVPAGSFPVTLKQQVDIEVDITLSMSGKHVKATENMTQWLASGIGPVKISDKTTVSAFGRTRTETSTSVLDGYRVDGETGGRYFQLSPGLDLAFKIIAPQCIYIV